jgi:uncharacterized protein YecE (DUF72 family)
MVNWYLGTRGFSYKDWSGVFYPARMASRDYLAHYSQIFSAVELDSTFYGIPRPEQVQRWAAVTPEDFKFTAKTPQEITHERRLTGAMGLMRNFLDTMRLLDDKLAVVLIRFPPDFTASEFSTLAGFLESLPTDVQYAVEFRLRSWYTVEMAELLKSHSVCWAATDYVNLPKQIHITTDFLYIRWISQHGRFARHDRVELDMAPQLQWWWEQIQMHRDSVKTIYGFFNNDYAGYSPSTCNKFKEIVGLPVQQATASEQGQLF